MSQQHHKCIMYKKPKICPNAHKHNTHVLQVARVHEPVLNYIIITNGIQR